jgi:DNA-binding LacI/PurR family transcriptional regulator
VDNHAARQAERAAELLLAQLTGAADGDLELSPDELVAPSLVVRSSTAPAPHRRPTVLPRVS